MSSNMTWEVDTYYKEYSCQRWNYWTYSEGRRIVVSEKQVLKAVALARIFFVVSTAGNQPYRVCVLKRQFCR